MRRIIFLAAAAAVAAAVLASTATGQTAAKVTTFASGLDHPNGLAFAPDGTLYVTEMGHGGEACYAEPNFIGFGDLGPACYGQTGAVTRIEKGKRDRIVTGLISYGVLGGAVTVGAEDIAVDGKGRLLIAMGARGGCQPTDVFPWWGRAQLGKLLSTTNGRHLRVIADVAGRQCAGGAHDSFPGGVAVAGERTYVADGGSGDMLMLQGGAIRSLGSITDAFPLSAAIGPDGAVYAGVCNCSGTGKVVRYAPGKKPVVVADTLGWVTGIAFGKDGALYVADEYFPGDDPSKSQGEILRIGKNGAKKTIVPRGDLHAVGHIAMGPDGALYVVNNVQFAASGEVLRIQL